MVVALGGPNDFLENHKSHLQAAPVVRDIYAEHPGTVQKVAARDIGVAVVALGGGRTRPEDPIDHAVGLTALAAIGDTVDGQRPLATVHARTEAAAEAASRAVRAAYAIGEGRAASGPSILDRIGAKA
jgi:thymidine phosphorylase